MHGGMQCLLIIAYSGTFIKRASIECCKLKHYEDVQTEEL